MSGLSNRSLGTSSSSSSEGRPRPVSLSPPSASSLALVARRSSAMSSMSSMSASSILLSTQRSNSRLTTDEELDPVTRAASKLNEIMEQGGIFFSCGSPRASGGQDELLLIDEIAEGLRFGRRSSLFGGSTTTDNGRQASNASSSSSSSSSDSQDNDDNGIELDSETSLRPAYELYRV